MQVQLVGLPASGKSTLVKGLVAKYPELYVVAPLKFNSYTVLLKSKPWFAFKILWICLPIIPICISGVSNSEVRLKDKVIAILGLFINLANYIYEFKRNEQLHKIVLWDEFLLQRSLSIFAYSLSLPNKDVIQKFANWVNKVCSCKSIFVTSELSYIERLHRRGLPIRMSKLAPDIVQGILAIQKLVLENLILHSENVSVINADTVIEDSILDLHVLLSKL